MEKGTKLAVIIIGMIAVGACQRNPSTDNAGAVGSLKYAVPEGWTAAKDAEGVTLSAPESVGMYYPNILVTRFPGPVTRRMAEDSRAIFTKNAGDKVSPLEGKRIGAAEGWIFTRRYVDRIARTLPRPKNPDYPLDVEHLETRLLLNSGAESFSIHFIRPVALDTKYHPEFERFLELLRF